MGEWWGKPKPTRGRIAGKGCLSSMVGMVALFVVVVAAIVGLN